ncbi:MAG: hypothetical protein HYR56_05435 [Acidobacteria bacterium]|nr:hypothetical protein [Acidobacteriota bacterium]MBI3426625.1 hypothetical protein [Acidobacteriota bacterium]
MTKQIFKRLAFPLIGSLLLLAATTSSAPQQDPTYRLMTLERRVDQLQQRLDYVERNQQNQSLNVDNGRNYNNELLRELQRQQLSLAQQSVELQQRMLELQKRIDSLNESLNEQIKKPEQAPAPAKPAESAKPKPTPRKP